MKTGNNRSPNFSQNDMSPQGHIKSDVTDRTLVINTN
jgi:hypothetical protein